MERASAPLAAVGPYGILGVLGEGGGGTVYRAWDPRLAREVALKVLHERPGADPRREHRFIAEARAASALNHANIVTVFDAAFDGTTPYIVSELIAGRTLREEIGRSPVAPKRLLDLATQIADGLSAAHDAGIVHRDLKPENIMVTRTGRVKIVDFGLAQPGGLDPLSEPSSQDDTQTRTDPGLRAGTIPYMSPEQARGATTDFRSDQFSFGLILFEMAAGRHAFTRDTPAATLNAIINDEPEGLSELDTRMPAAFRWIVERCLAKDVNDRYAVTSDLLRDFRMLRDRFGELVAAQRASSARPIASGWTRGLLAIALLAAFVAGAIVTSFIAVAPRRTSTALTFTPFTTGAGYQGFPAWSPDGQTIAYAADVNDTLQIFTRRVSSPVAAQITQAPYDCRYPFWSPDGNRIYYVSLARDRDGIWSVGAAGGTPQVVVESASRGAIAPSGTIAFLRDEQPEDIVGASALWLRTADGVETRYRAFDHLRFVEGALSFSPDGSKLAVSAVPRSINVPPEERGWRFWIAPLRGGVPSRRFESLSDVVPRVTSFAWLPDSRHVVLSATTLSTTGSHLWMADVERNEAWPLTSGPGSESYPSSSPDGDQVVFATGEPDYDVVEISTGGGTVRPLLATARNESDPVWSPNGRLLAYVSDRSGQDEIWLGGQDKPGSDRPVITQRDFGDDRTIMLASPSFSPDGERIAYQRNASKPIWPLRIWISQTAGGPPVPLVPPSHEGYQGAPTWSPDGQWIAYAEWTDRQWTLAKVRAGSGEPPIALRPDGVPNATPSWSPKDDWITWETNQGFVLVSPDGTRERVLSDDHWLAHTWSRDGSHIFGIRETERLRLSLVAIDVSTGSARVIADLGPSPPVNNPVKGLSLAADGRTLLTSFVHLRGGLWTVSGLRVPEPASRWRALFRLR
ncbi:MAG TPA: protein kinase [Vicinamibacterales bacterium]|nr:protein kinase [Vicinamibacterales bacterium]